MVNLKNEGNMAAWKFSPVILTLLKLLFFFYRLLLTLLKYTLRKYFVLTCKKITK